MNQKASLFGTGHHRFIIALLCLTVHVGTLRAEDKMFSDDIFKVFRDSSGHAYFEKGKESYYTAYLAAMKEPALMGRRYPADTFALRFTWLRSFHDPIAIRVWREGDEYRIRGVRLARHHDYGPGAITKDGARSLTKSEIMEIQKFTSAKDLWQPLNNQEKYAMAGGMDGAQWIFELRNHQDYTMIDLWAPKAFGPEGSGRIGVDMSKLRDFMAYVRIGLYLLKITDLLPNDREIY